MARRRRLGRGRRPWSPGVLGLCAALHGLVIRAIDVGALRRELDAVRGAHDILADELAEMSERLTLFGETVQNDATRRNEELTHEVHMLEDLVQRMSESLDRGPAQPARAQTAPQAAPTINRPAPCFRPYARRSMQGGSISICKPSSACRSDALSSTRASRVSATKADGY